MSYAPPQQPMDSCPQCQAYIPVTSTYCPRCMAPLQRCATCGFFLYPNRPNCVRCGAYVMREPRVTAKVWIEGGGIVGDNEAIKIQLENVGTVPTDVVVKIEGPEGLEPREFEDDTIRNINPGQPVQRVYQFTVNAPGDYVLERIDISYLKSSGDRERIPVSPVKFKIYGRPMVQLNVMPETCRIPLGEIANTYVVLKNTGTAAALFVKVESAFPTSVQIQDSVVTLPELKPDEERAALLRIRPLFTGTHTCKVRATYLSPATDQLSPVGFESMVKTINIIAELRELAETERKDESKPSGQLSATTIRKR